MHKAADEMCCLHSSERRQDVIGEEVSWFVTERSLEGDPAQPDHR